MYKVLAPDFGTEAGRTFQQERNLHEVMLSVLVLEVFAGEAKAC